MTRGDLTIDSSRPSPSPQRRSNWLETARNSWLRVFLDKPPILEIDVDTAEAAPDSQATVVAAFRLQDVADYRTALRTWFGWVRIGGHLIVAVPHAFLYERQIALPSRWNPKQRRLYTPRVLIEEVEEALAPNSYRVRHLGDRDGGYDYRLQIDQPPVGECDVVLVLQKIAPPAWQPAAIPRDRSSRHRPAAPDYAFETPRTRVEISAPAPRRRILILKLDHLGDFIMAIAALERARALFADAELTLVVGSWNIDVARGLGLADHVVAFDAFPRNSSEEAVDVAGKAALFDATVTGKYDIAIDLRTDTDTRQLLRRVDAAVRAGIGTRAQFPFLDIFLPLDGSRNEQERAHEDVLDHHVFSSQATVARLAHRLVARAADAERHSAIVWGPYWPLRPGRYLFDPYLEVAQNSGGLLMIDVALDAVRVAHAIIDGPGSMRLEFAVENPGARFEFRVWTVTDAPAIDFSFFGGRLIRAGAASVLHQSEYASLMIELVAMRIGRTGTLTELSGARPG